LNGSGRWHAEQAWLGHRADNVLIEVEHGFIKAVTEDAAEPAGATRLKGWTIPGLANVHSHVFQRSMRGTAEFGGGDFWEWRNQMYQKAEMVEPGRFFNYAREVFGEMLKAGITAVGEFHYLHAWGNQLGEELIEAARSEGIRITLLDACYLRGGMDGRPLEGAQKSFSDGDVERWAERVDRLKDAEGVRIGAAIHSVRAVDPASMRTVAEWARIRNAPLHIHLAEQPAEVEECLALEGCTPTQLLEREEILGPDLTAVHAIHLDLSDIASLGENKVSICACTTTERDLGDRVGPLRASSSGLVAPGDVRLAAIGAFGVAGIAGLLLSLAVDWRLLIAGAACLLAGWLYTGGPKPYGYLGLGEVFVFVFFGLVATVGTVYLETSRITPLSILMGCAMGFLATAILVMNNLRDIDTDAAAGKRTLATRIGRQGTRWLLLVLVCAAFAVPIVVLVTKLAGVTVMLVHFGIPVAAVPVRVAFASEAAPDLVRALKRMAAVQVAYALLFTLGVLL